MEFHYEPNAEQRFLEVVVDLSRLIREIKVLAGAGPDGTRPAFGRLLAQEIDQAAEAMALSAQSLLAEGVCVLRELPPFIRWLKSDGPAGPPRPKGRVITLKLGRHSFPVRINREKLVDEDGRELWAITDPKRHEIVISPEAPRRERISLLRHEWWHVVCLYFPVPDCEEQQAIMHATASEHFEEQLHRQGGETALLDLEPSEPVGEFRPPNGPPPALALASGAVGPSKQQRVQMAQVESAKRSPRRKTEEANATGKKSR